MGMTEIELLRCELDECYRIFDDPIASDADVESAAQRADRIQDELLQLEAAETAFRTGF
jgi:hypothetical protein